MPITLDSLTFDADYTQVREHLEEVGGRDARELVLSGLIVDENTVAAIEARLDAILDATSTEDFSAALSLRAGREIFVRRTDFVREIQAAKLTGSFRLVLEARDPFEWATAQTQYPWAIVTDPDTIQLATIGNIHALPIVTLNIAGSDRTDPSIGDGTRTLSYSGTVKPGERLTIDAEQSLVKLDNTDVTPYTTGEFPRIDPSGITMVYADSSSTSPEIEAYIDFRDRWW